MHLQSDLHDELRTIDGEVIFSEMTETPTWHALLPPSTNTGAPTIVLVKSSVDKPMEVYSLRANYALVQLSNHGASITPHPTKLTPLALLSQDQGVEISAIFISPSASPPGPQRTVVLVHAGPYERLTNSFMPDYGYIPYLTSLGFSVLRLNYCGSCARGDMFARFPYVHGPVTCDYDDVIAVTSHAVNSGLADKDNLVVAGWSLGGYLAYLACVRNSLHGYGWGFKGAICGAGVADGDSMIIDSDIPVSQAAMVGVLPWRSGDKGDTRNRRESAIWERKKAAEDGRMPRALILHGEKDDRVPVSQGRSFWRGCEDLGAECEMVGYPDEGHVFRKRENSRDLSERIGRFCESYT